MRIRTSWEYVQPAENTYDWTGLDEAVRLATEHHKFIGLSVSAGVSAPQWVYDTGAQKYVLQDGSGRSMPLSWDSGFLTKWLAFVRAIGARYDGNPAVRYVVMSGMCSETFETYFAKAEPDVTNLTALGGSSAWTNATKQIIATYAEAFPTTAFFLTLAKPFPTAEGLAALKEVTDWAAVTYPGRFGIMNSVLNAKSNTGYYPNEAVYSYRSTQPTGFQMLCASSDSERLGGTLEQALTKGVELGGKFVEVYEQDVENPEQQSLLASIFHPDISRDILLENKSTGQRAIWLMDDTQRNSGANLWTVATTWNIVGKADFNADGKADILWQDNTSGQRAIWFMNGIQRSSGVNFATVDRSWSIAAAGDFNGDAKPDLVWQNSKTGARAIWLMDGTRPAGSVNYATVAISWNIVGTGDFNGDGKSDILWRNRSTGGCIIWLMNGTQRSNTVFLGTVDPSWDIAGSGDFNDDGKPDILWQNGTTGTRAIWLMDGTQLNSTASLGAAATSWDIRNH